MKAYAYLRVSGKGQVDKGGLPRQRAAIQKYAREHGIEIAQWFEERGVSGTLEHREQLDAMLVALLSNGVRAVVVEKLDRLSRDLRIQENLIHEYFTNRFELISTCEPDLGSEDPNRIFVRQIFGAIAQLDKANIVLRLRAARQRKKAESETKRCEGRKPYGAREGEQVVLERMRQLRAAGSGYAAIATALNADGIPTRMGKSWRGETIRNMLQ